MSDSQLIPILGVGLVVIGLFFSLFAPRQDRRRLRRAVVVFTVGTLILVVDYLVKNADTLAQIQPQWALVLLAIGFILFQLARLRA